MTFPLRSGVVLLGDGSVNTASTRVLTFDASWVVGDVITATFVFGSGSGVTISAPAGWSQPVATRYNASVCATATFEHTMAAGESSATTATFTLSAGSRYCGLAFAMFGVSSNVDAAIDGTGTNGTTSVVAPALTTIQPVTYVVSIFAARWLAVIGKQLITEPGTHTQIGNAGYTNVSSLPSITVMASYLTTNPTSAGSQGPYTATAAATPSNQNAIQLSFSPLLPVPATPLRRARPSWLARLGRRPTQVFTQTTTVTTQALPPQPRRPRATLPWRAKRTRSSPPPTISATLPPQTSPRSADRFAWFAKPRRRSTQVFTQVTVTTTQALPPQQGRPRQVLPWRARRGRGTTVVTFQAPLPPQPSPRTADRPGWLPRPRRASVTPVPTTTVTVTTQALPPQAGRVLHRQPVQRRDRATFVPVTTVVVTTQGLPPQPIRDRLVWFPYRRATQATPPATVTVLVQQPARRRQVPVLRSRGRATTVPVQIVVLPPQPSPRTTDRFGWLAPRRKRGTQFVPAQVIVQTTQAIPPQGRRRLFGWPTLRRTFTTDVWVGSSGDVEVTVYVPGSNVPYLDALTLYVSSTTGYVDDPTLYEPTPGVTPYDP